MRSRILKSVLAGGVCALALGAAAMAQPRDFNVPAGDLAPALDAYIRQSGEQLVYRVADARGVTTGGVHGTLSSEEALAQLLAGTSLKIQRDPSGLIAVASTEAQDPQGGSAGGGAAGNAVDALIVTAQKREENIQDVPIAISAFSQTALEEQKLEGGFDLLKAVPNVTFSKNNFSGYNFSIRGIGTKAISVTTDPGVAVAFNNVTLIRNRLFEQEYFDMERVEVLRGPQGTLYGRNATSGVINLISAKPDMNEFKGSIKGEVGNYHAKRIVGMVNVPLIEDKLAVRFAGAITSRDGYGVNLYDNSPVDGRDLWSARLTVGFEPSERLRANLIWERFEEDDDRARTSKQLCHRDPGPDSVGGVEVTDPISRGFFTQGCLPGSLYDDNAYGTPNGAAIPFVLALQTFSVGFPATVEERDRQGCIIACSAIPGGADPYGGRMQSRNLREIYSQLDAIYQAKADILELNIELDVTPNLTFFSQTAYNKDTIYSSQDFNRFTTLPVFRDTAGLTKFQSDERGFYNHLMPGGIFCDPQLGCSNTIVGKDLSRAKSDQFSQEFRIQSGFDGPVNFSAGLGYTRYRTVEDYYVFFNGITLSAIVALNGGPGALFTGSPSLLSPDKFTFNPDCTKIALLPICVPIETNPISHIQDTGHNYFLSRNPYRVASKAAFGEVYFEPSSEFKITAGLRYTDDKKVFTPIPSQTLLTGPEVFAYVNPAFPRDILERLKAFPLIGTGQGYPALPDEERRWREVTGRLGFDWTPDLVFTDRTMIYAFYSRGYKGGGLNPPPLGLNYEAAEANGVLHTPSAPREFRPEFVNAYEAGAKNTLLSGAMLLNASAFFYDYKDYQVSKIVDRSAQNENFDARIWGLEIEGIFSPTRNLRFNGAFGYLDTEIGEGSMSIDIMNRTGGHDDWVIVKPAITLTSNCIAPVSAASQLANSSGFLSGLCPGGVTFPPGVNYSGNPSGIGGEIRTLPDGTTYDPRDHPEANYGAGFFTDISGNELPNSPHWTASLGAQYSFEFLETWKGTVRADGYWQSQSWARAYQLPIDKLHGWYNANLSIWLEREDGLKIELYAKNILDKSPITDTFTNSDDTALTTNVFVLDPRLIGLSVRKEF